jgi:hypothetical protein
MYVYLGVGVREINNLKLVCSAVAVRSTNLYSKSLTGITVCTISHGNRFEVTLAAKTPIAEMAGGIDRLAEFYTQELEELESLAQGSR